MSDKLTENEISLLRLIGTIRDAVGDPHGKLMQDDLVERCRKLHKDSARLDWIEQNRVSLSFVDLWGDTDKKAAWVVQAKDQVVGNIANSPTMRRAIDKALATNPEVGSEYVGKETK